MQSTDATAMPGHDADEGAVELSVVIPARDEVDAIVALVEEIRDSLTGVIAFETIVVDDGSTDGTTEALAKARARFPELRVLKHDRSCGQSAGLRTGITAARGRLIATLDGDGQNDPADIPRLLDVYRKHQDAPGPGPRVAMVAGQRAKRKDTAWRRFSSRFANGVRARLLKDETPDSGCGLKLFSRAVFLRLPYFDHMHRFLPALVRREGYGVAHQAVNHRPREAGRSKYGTLDRALAGIVDLIGVVWLQRRSRRPGAVTEIAPKAAASAED